MRVTVNPTTCIASGNCSRTAPRVFANREEDDGYVSVLDENPPESEWAAVREAEDLCPSATIHVEDDPGTT
ncbi:ferredoxin [Myceligenerans pegani]|uniref:Ferredoxin n=1 Tax=Myceligenerans pegani TaxID=2776917 RepID=A0ABR9MXS0_9MICO|nr:ferredoxin [Myceligenerans sp. TRM 65318]MBE1876194.1 ferredoxin [Myceligenerans sp. TRM 65318]MBE3018465.1 ferredoxin [Myceligenerans sp. TRM 65318]